MFEAGRSIVVWRQYRSQPCIWSRELGDKYSACCNPFGRQLQFWRSQWYEGFIITPVRFRPYVLVSTRNWAGGLSSAWKPTLSFGKTAADGSRIAQSLPPIKNPL